MNAVLAQPTEDDAPYQVAFTPAAFVAVIEFPSADAAEAVFEDPDYQSLVPARDSGLASLNVYLTT